MDWKLLLTAFTTLFLAELGDKTMIAAFCMSASGKKWIIFIGAMLALTMTTLIAVFAGEFLAKYVPVRFVRLAAGFVFVIIGIWFILSKSPA